MLESEYANTIEIKKIFVLGARMLSRRTNSSKRARSCHITISSNNAGNPEEMDLEFLIPGSHLQMMRAHNEWCWNDPWRAAEAVHFLNLSQRFLYMKIIGRAFRAAMHLRLGSVHCAREKFEIYAKTETIFYSWSGISKTLLAQNELTPLWRSRLFAINFTVLLQMPC